MCYLLRGQISWLKKTDVKHEAPGNIQCLENNQMKLVNLGCLALFSKIRWTTGSRSEHVTVELIHIACLIYTFSKLVNALMIYPVVLIRVLQLNTENSLIEKLRYFIVLENLWKMFLAWLSVNKTLHTDYDID